MQVAPNQISPGENFDVFYFVRNPFDSGTYYVRAKLYDVRTGALLDTVVLDQSPTNARLFIKTVQAPPDPSGYGRNIVAIASMYTDSAFTTQSDAYEEQEQYYLIKAVAPVLGGGGVDYRALREMFRDVLRETLPVPPQMPWESLFGTLGVIQRELNRVPKESFDASTLELGISELREALAALPQPQTDLTPLTKRVSDVLDAVASLRIDNKNAEDAMTAAHEKETARFLEDVLARIEAGLRAVMQSVAESHVNEMPKPTPSPISIEHLF